ncbi:hypothetical protein KU735_22995, partial [Salmonella enterica subsp. enterica serovar Give]|nr:hypothetical protein [Salmonella enterica subsp. enterica serovar Give]
APQRMAHTPKKLKHGHIDDDALAFAIFSADGKMLLHDGDNGQNQKNKRQPDAQAETLRQFHASPRV